VSDASLIDRAAPAAAGASQISDFVALLKPRVMSLVVFTGFVGYFIAPTGLHPVAAAMAVLCIAVGAGAAGAINMWFDRDIDAVMRRTCARPLPSGRVAPDDALAFGVFLSLGAVLMMGLAANWLAAGLLATAILFYVLVYTVWLKRRTPQNIVIGGAAGAFPPMIGWAAATGGLSWTAVALFLLIFCWTPPHFWALALYRSGDYRRAGVPMLPVVAGRRATKWQLLAYTLLLLPLSLVPVALGSAGWVYAVPTAALGLLFVVAAARVLREPEPAAGETAPDRAAKQMFGFSILYLFMVFAMLIVDRAAGPVL